MARADGEGDLVGVGLGLAAPTDAAATKATNVRVAKLFTA
jgi:hypothetical protein